MSIIVNPSTALIVHGDTTIESCVGQMRDHNVGSILVVGDRDGFSDQLVGIFTQRDLMKNASQIQAWPQWERQVRTVMTSPVMTIPLSEIQKAPEFMVRHGFAHLPVVDRAENGAEHIMGVISMTDLFYATVHESKSVPPIDRLPEKVRKVGIVTADRNPNADVGLRKGLSQQKLGENESQC